VRPVALYDSEYGSGTFLTHTQDIACDLLFRIRPNRTLRRVPGPYSGRGRPSLHGAVFRLSDPTTCGSPNASWEGEDAELGPVRVECWYALHFEDAPKRLLDVFRIQRLNARGTRRDPSVVWLGWCGQAPLEISTGWCDYLRRYVIEHWYRFANQSLRWKLPQLSTPAQGELWAVTLPRGYPTTLSGASDRTRPAPSLAESSARSNPRPDASGNGGSFGRDRYTRRPAQTSRKILRLALRTDPQ
jgi:hypothetical protein